MNRWEKNEVASETATTATSEISLAGSVIVAAPSLTDGIFGRSVCIIVEHSADRAVGILLNKRLDTDVRPIWKHIVQTPLQDESDPEVGLADDASSCLIGRVNFGGPSSGPIVAIHQTRELAEGGNDLGVYLAAEAEHLKKLVQLPEQDYRLYVGHAVWGPRELERQIVSGNWHALPAAPELVFDNESTMWQRAIRTVGNEFVRSITGLPPSPEAEWN